MQLVIVESPAKAKTIEKYLGADFKVLASYGHVRDLPPKDGSVRPDEDFAMDWELYRDKQSRFKEISGAAKNASRLVLATDPDRECAVLVQTPEDVVELLSSFDDTPRSSFREGGAFDFDHATEELAEAEPADIADLLTTAPVAADELIRQSGSSAASVQLSRLELEIAGRLERHAGGRVCIVG
jgi:DNA topoisomerase IA